MTDLSTAPVEETTLAEIAEDDQHRHDQRALAVRALRELRRTGWIRSRSYDFERQLGYTFHHPDKPGQVLNLDTFADLTVWYGWFSYEVEDVQVAVDMLAALKVLPFYLSSAYDEGHTDGRNSVVFDVSHVAEFSEHEFGDPDERHVDAVLLSARTYWLSKLNDPAVRYGIGRELDGLLDKVPAVRRRQVDLVIEAVTEPLEANHG